MGLKDQITHDMNGVELTPEDVAVYRESLRISRAAIAQCNGKQIGLLQAVGFQMFEMFMQHAKPEAMRLVVPGLRKMADDMEAKARKENH